MTNGGQTIKNHDSGKTKKASKKTPARKRPVGKEGVADSGQRESTASK